MEWNKNPLKEKNLNHLIINHKNLTFN